MDRPSRRAAVIALVLLVTVAYANSLGNRFTNWDDEHLIVRNRAIRTFSPLFVLENFHLSYPPVTVFSHCADYLFWGLNPVGYHLTNLLLYACAVVCFFGLCRRITASGGAALAAAAIFAVHPLHVESVTWLSSRKDGLAILFYLLAFLSYCRSGGGKGRGMLWLSVAFYFIAVWSKPLAATLPLALMAYDALLDRRGRSAASIVLGKLPYAVPLLLTAAATVLLDPHNEISFSHPAGAYTTFLMMLTVLADYARMLVLPIGLSPYYIVSMPAGLLEAPVIASALLLVLIAAAGVLAVRRAPIAAFCISWAFVSLLPVMQIVPLNVVKADRYLYIPSAALCLLAGAALGPLISRRRRLLATSAVAALVTVFTLLTVRGNAVWKDSVTLWRAVLARNPRNADAANNLGIALMRRGDYAGAERVLKRALEIRPAFASAHNNLANVYLRTGRYAAAHAELGKAAGLKNDIVYSASFSITEGMVFEAEGRYGKAVAAYEEALRSKPVYMDGSFIRERIGRCRRLIRGRRSR